MSLSLNKDLQQYAEENNKGVEGWLSPQDIEVTLHVNQAQLDWNVQGNVGEIGVHHGRYYLLLHLLRRAEEKGLALDVWSKQEFNVDGSGAGDKEKFLANFEKYAGDDALVVVDADSTQVSAKDLIQAAGGPLRLFSVDGGHNADVVLHDLHVAAEAIGDHGVVILDDCFNPRWPGVSCGLARFFYETTYAAQSEQFLVAGIAKQCEEFVAKFASPFQRVVGRKTNEWLNKLMHATNRRAALLAPFAITNNKVFLTKPNAAQRYLRHLARTSLNHKRFGSEFYDYNVFYVE